MRAYVHRRVQPSWTFKAGVDISSNQMRLRGSRSTNGYRRPGNLRAYVHAYNSQRICAAQYLPPAFPSVAYMRVDGVKKYESSLTHELWRVFCDCEKIDCILMAPHCMSSFGVNTLHAVGIAPSGSRPSAGSVMTNFMPCTANKWQQIISWTNNYQILFCHVTLLWLVSVDLDKLKCQQGQCRVEKCIWFLFFM